MLNRIVKKSKSNKGFTLVELIVVIAIIGILAGMMLPRLSGFTDDARIAKAQSEVKSLANLIVLYDTQNGSYPTIGTGTADIEFSGGTLVYDVDGNTTTVNSVTKVTVGGTDITSTATAISGNVAITVTVGDSSEVLTINYQTGEVTN